MNTAINTRKRGMRSLTKQVMGVTFGLIAITAIVLGGLGLSFLGQSMSASTATYKTTMHSGYDMEIKSQVQSAISVVQGFYDQFKKGELSEEEAQKLAKEAIRSMRYREDHSGYMWIDSTDYTLLMHPILEEQEGSNRYELTDQNGVKIIQVIMEAAEAGGGYNEFYFTKADGITVAPKVAYSQMFEPWQWVITTGNYVDDMNVEIDKAEQNIEKQFKGMLVTFGIINIIIIIIAMIISMFFGKRLTEGIQKVKNDLQKAATGDLTFQVDGKVKERADEIGEIARSLESVKCSLVGMIGNVSEASIQLCHSSGLFNEKFENITEGIQSINVAIEELAQGTMSQSNETGVVHTKLEELQQVIYREQQEMQKLKAVVGTMTHYSDDVAGSIEALYKITNITVNAIETVSEQTNRTNNAARHINKVIEMIKGVAEQTNLLSLNARIEAAHAGDVGKGFAVVAGEIYSLAEESARSAEEIEVIVKELIENAEISKNEMQQVIHNVKEQQTQLAESKSIFSKLYDEIQTVRGVADEVGNQTNILEALKGTVSKAVDVLLGDVEESIAATQETSASMQVLTEFVNECMEDTKKLVDLSEKQKEDAMKFKL